MELGAAASPTCSKKRCLSARAASRMQELDVSIAQTDQELASQTRNLLSIGEGAHRAYREQMELKAEVSIGS